MNIQYCISKIEENEYRYNFDFDYSQFNAEENTAFQIGHEIKAISESKEIAISISIEIHATETKPLLVRNITRCIFGVEPFQQFVTSIQDDGVQVAFPDLMDTFINIAIGTARGILFKNLKGTPLQVCTLPLIPMSVIQESARTKKRISKE